MSPQGDAAAWQILMPRVGSFEKVVDSALTSEDLHGWARHLRSNDHCVSSIAKLNASEQSPLTSQDRKSSMRTGWKCTVPVLKRNVSQATGSLCRVSAS